LRENHDKNGSISNTISFIKELYDNYLTILMALDYFFSWNSEMTVFCALNLNYKSFVHEVFEDSRNFVNEIGENLNKLFAVDLGILEFHLFQLVQLSARLTLQKSEVDTIRSLGGLYNRLLSKLIVSNDSFHHSGCLNLIENTFSRGQVKSCSEKAFCCRNSPLIILAI
jgi:hypothetical protein